MKPQLTERSERKLLAELIPANAAKLSQENFAAVYETGIFMSRIPSNTGRNKLQKRENYFLQAGQVMKKLARSMSPERPTSA